MSCRRVLIAITAGLPLAGCAGAGVGTAPAPAGMRVAIPEPAVKRAAAAQIEHIVVMVQENRSFDDLFATFPGADGATSGKMHNGQVVALKQVGLAALDINHTY